MIKVIKNHFHNHKQTVFDRIVYYETQAGLDNDIWNMTNYVENMTGHKPKIIRTKTTIIIGSSLYNEQAIWHFYPAD